MVVVLVIVFDKCRVNTGGEVNLKKRLILRGCIAAKRLRFHFLRHKGEGFGFIFPNIFFVTEKKKGFFMKFFFKYT
jgi:hypothetical protein